MLISNNSYLHKSQSQKETLGSPVLHFFVLDCHRACFLFLSQWKDHRLQRDPMHPKHHQLEKKYHQIKKTYIYDHGDTIVLEYDKRIRGLLNLYIYLWSWWHNCCWVWPKHQRPSKFIHHKFLHLQGII